jgi:hypothetical protein
MQEKESPKIAHSYRRPRLVSFQKTNFFTRSCPRVPPAEKTCRAMHQGISLLTSMNHVLDKVRSRSITRLSAIVLCCALYLVPVVRAQSTTGGQKTPNRPDVRPQHIAEPPELAGEPGPITKPPTPALQFRILIEAAL